MVHLKPSDLWDLSLHQVDVLYAFLDRRSKAAQEARQQQGR